jgi:hypothetical protein
MNMDLNEFSSALIGAFLGGVLAGLFALLAVEKQEKVSRKLVADEDEAMITATVRAMMAELDVIYERYQATVGGLLEKLEEGKAFIYFFPVFSDFFTIYNTNAHVIGRIRSAELRSKFVKTYVLSKGLVDSFVLNNKMLEEFATADAVARANGNAAQKDTAHAALMSLEMYGGQLKQMHFLAVESYLGLKETIGAVYPDR